MGSIQFNPSNLIPNLDEIVGSDSGALQPGPYSKGAFLEFLKSAHCAENLEFILDVDKYINRYSQSENVPFLDDEAILENSRLAKLWSYIYETYMSRSAPQEVNVPGKLLDHFAAESLPEPKELLILRKAVYELLSVNYNEFITSTRESHTDRKTTFRRFSEAVAPETLTRDSYPPLEVSSPDTIFNTISPDLSAQWEKTLEIYEVSKLASSCESSGAQSRTNSAGGLSTRPSSRGSSLGSVFDNIREYSGWKKTVKKLRTRRASSEKQPDNLSF